MHIVCSVTPAWVFSETFRINLSFLQHILTDALLGKGDGVGDLISKASLWELMP